MKNVVDLSEKTFGKVNVIFNNAGIMHSDDDNAMTTEEAVWDLTLNVNMKGVFLGCKYGIFRHFFISLYFVSLSLLLSLSLYTALSISLC